MLRHWFDRLKGNPGAPPAGAPEADGVRDEGVMPNPAFVARRPLISGRGEIGGFELGLNDATQWQLINLADPAAESAYAVALLGAMNATAQSGRIAYGRMSADLLLRREVAEQLAPRMMLCVQMPESPARDTVERVCALRMTGAQIG